MSTPSDAAAAPGPLFATTAWSVVREAQDPGAPNRSRALERLIAVHWRPVFWTIRREWGAGPEEAQDLTQEYFAAFLERDLLAPVSEDRGRFRSYVKATLRHFMLHARRGERAARRGGRIRIEPLDDLARIEAEGPAGADPPDRSFDRELLRSVLRRAQRDVAAACELEGRPAHYALFEAYCQQLRAGEVRYPELEARFDLRGHEVKNRLVEMRLRFRRAVLDLVRDGVSSESELVAEMRELFGR